jgi:hypothetical protein
MKIPLAFGYIRVMFDGQNSLYFECTANPVLEEILIQDNIIDIYGNHDNEDLGRHFQWSIRCFDQSPQVQDNIAKFLYFHRTNRNADRSFQIYPIYNSDLITKSYHDAGLFRVFNIEQPKLFQLTKNKQKGNGLILNLMTVKKVSNYQYECLLYRNSNNGSWGIYGRTTDLIGRLQGGLSGSAGFGLA